MTAIIAVLLFVVLTSAKDPMRDGIRLSAILSESNNLWPQMEITPGGTLSIPTLTEDQKKMIEALRAMTDEASPILFKELHARDSKLKKLLSSLLQKQSVIKWDFTTAEQRRRRAFRALIGGAPFISPGLIEMEPQIKEPAVLEALELLATIRYQGEDFREVCWILIKAGEKAKPAIPQLIEFIKSHDMGVRPEVCSALAAIGEEAVPHVAKLLDDPGLAPLGALYALTRMKSNLRNVLPRVASHLNNSDKDIRRLAVEVLVAEEQLDRDLLVALSDRMHSEPDDQIRELISEGLNGHSLATEESTNN